MGVTLRVGTAVILAAGLLAPAAFGLTGVPVIPKDRRITAISSAADTDTFVFQGVEGGRLSLTVKRRSGNLNPTIEILDVAGDSQDLSGVLSETPGLATVDGFKFPSTGPFAIVVGGEGSTTGQYLLTVGATRIPGVSTAVEVAAGQSKDVEFQGVEGGAVNFKVERFSGGYPAMPGIRTPGNTAMEVDARAIRKTGRAWVARRLPLDAGTGTYKLRINGPTSGEPAVVRVYITPVYSPGRPTKVILPSTEPVVLSVSPFSVKGGQTVKVTGTNFSNRAQVVLSKLFSPDVMGESVVVAPGGTSLTFQVPTDASGIYSVSVSNPEGQAATLADAVSVDSGAVGSAGVTPSTGPTFGGTLVTVTGVGFEPGISVKLVQGAVVTPVTVNLVSATELNFTTPASPAGTVDIVLQNIGEAPKVRSQAFTFTDEGTSRYFDDVTTSAIPALSQSGDSFAGSRGAVIDLDGDDDDDLLLQSSALLPGGASLRILHQVEPGVLVDATHGSIPDRYGGFDSAVDLGEGPGFAVGDLDGDDFPDVVVTSRGYVPIGDNPGSNIYYRLSYGVFAMTQSAGLAGDYPIYWNDFYSATRILKNDGNGSFFSSPISDGGTRRIPLVGFFVDNGVLPAAEAVSNAFAVDADGIPTLDPGFVASGADGGERFEGDAVALADLDGDGSLDIVVASNASVVETRALDGVRPTPLKPYVYFANFARPSTRILLNTLSNGVGSGVFKESAFPLFDPSRFAFPDTGYDDRGQAVDIGVDDLNGDGLPDLVLVADRRFELTHSRPGAPVTEYRTGTRVFINKGEGQFDDATRSNMPTVDVAPVASPDFFAATRVALGDLDGDGDVDMVLTSSTGTYIGAGRPYTRILLNRDGSGAFDDATTTNMPAVAGAEVWQANGILLMDVDLDTDLDIILTTTDGAITGTKAGTRVLLNNGEGVFEATPPGIGPDTFIPPQGGGELWQGDLVLSGDLNGDGQADIVISEDNPGAANATRILFRK